MKKILIILFLSQLFIHCAVVGDGASDKNIIPDVYDELSDARNYATLTNVLQKCKMLSWEDQEKVLMRCLNNIRTSNEVPFDEPFSNKVHDLSLVQGRNAWLISNMLSVELPLVNASTSEQNSSGIRKMVFDKMLKVKIEKKAQSAALLKDELINKTLEDREELARQTSSDITLMVLAKDENAGVRRIVAANLATHPSVLAELAENDPDSDVRNTAIKNLEKARTLKLNE